MGEPTPLEMLETLLFYKVRNIGIRRLMVGLGMIG